MEETKSKSKKTSSTPNRIYVIGAVVVVLLAIGGYFGWMKYQAMQNTPEAQAKVQDEKKATNLAMVKKVMVVPEEDPTMLEVNNAEQLKGQQAFFKDVQNGDVLFIFPKALKAIIFRPSANVVVNSGPLQTEAPAAPKAPAPEVKAPTTSTSKK
jgi:hypothetical protein